MHEKQASLPDSYSRIQSFESEAVEVILVDRDHVLVMKPLNWYSIELDRLSQHRIIVVGLRQQPVWPHLVRPLRIGVSGSVHLVSPAPSTHEKADERAVSLASSPRSSRHGRGTQ